MIAKIHEILKTSLPLIEIMPHIASAIYSKTAEANLCTEYLSCILVIITKCESIFFVLYLTILSNYPEYMFWLKKKSTQLIQTKVLEHFFFHIFYTSGAP